MRRYAMLAMLALLLGAPLAAAQNETGGDTDVIMNPPDDVDVDINDNDGDVEESTVGWSTTTVLVVVLVAVLLIALIVVAAGRDRW